MYCNAQSHTDNCDWTKLETGLAIFTFKFDWSTSARKAVVIAENTTSKSKTMLEMTAAGLDGHWESTTSLMHRPYSCNDGLIAHSVFMWCLMSSRSVMHVLYTLSCNIPNWIYLNPANLVATVKAEWILAFLFLQKRHLQWRHSYVIIT